MAKMTKLKSLLKERYESDWELEKKFQKSLFNLKKNGAISDEVLKDLLKQLDELLSATRIEARNEMDPDY